MAAQQAPAFEKDKLYNLPIIDIKPAPDQPRKYTDPQTLEELAASVKQLVILQPVLSRQGDQGDRGREYNDSKGGKVFLPCGKIAFADRFVSYAVETNPA